MPERWTNVSPGDLSVSLPEVVAGDVAKCVERAQAVAPGWAQVSLHDRIQMIRAAQAGLSAAKEELARGISIETGKPLIEAQGEVNAVIAKFDFTIADAEAHLADRSDQSGSQAAIVRQRPRGPAAVIGPFNFPLHLAHGANVAHLLAGNPVIYKPSPLVANIAARYGQLMAPHFPFHVFQILQGGANEGEALCLDPGVRAVCFTGSVPVGRTLAQKLAGDLSKDVALELGGNNSLIVCADADLDKAASAAADGVCLTAGQRCNATSRVIVDRRVASEFIPRLLTALREYEPADPSLPTTRLGPLISADAVGRYARLCDRLKGAWLLPGNVEPVVNGKRGHYVRPAAIKREDDGHADPESFVPIVSVFIAADLDDAVRLQSATPYGLTASVFTRSEKTFRRLGEQLEVGNLYANLPTTFSPSTLPFGGWRDSGNGRPGGRGFIRFTTREQAVQYTGFEAK